jgi:hypothetical protein
MNRFAALGLLAEAIAGRQLVVISLNGTEASAALEDVLRAGAEFVGQGESIDDLDLIIRRANGDQQIRTREGGRVRFISADPRSIVRLRGAKVDAVLLEPGAASRLDPHDVAAIAARGAEVVRA